jgi:hypothetical protein
VIGPCSPLIAAPSSRVLWGQGRDQPTLAAGHGRTTRNGTSPTTLITEHGKVDIDALRDRDGSFALRIVKKRQRRFEGSVFFLDALVPKDP